MNAIEARNKIEEVKESEIKDFLYRIEQGIIRSVKDGYSTASVTIPYHLYRRQWFRPTPTIRLETIMESVRQRGFSVSCCYANSEFSRNAVLYIQW